MKTIHKYPIYVGQNNCLSIPKDSKIILVANQKDFVTIWIEVDLTKEFEERNFHIYGTGHDIQKNVRHIESCIVDPFVWHVYEEVA